ncbi:MAG: CPBP family intramembrane metalloprotease [Deltaproteobacteria bacterium]|nr:CPBP family intramembrane metalloprotease [Deltaproteobacteria bacterium]
MAVKHDPSRPLAPSLEALALLALTLPLALWLHEPSLWFLVPFALITLRRRDYADYGLDLSQRRRWGGLWFHLLNLALLALYAAGHLLFARWWLGSRFALTAPQSPHMLLFSQLLGVALPEEFFFRGYLQSQLNRTLGQRTGVLGVRCGLGLPLAALLFALCHIPLGGPAQVIVIFPGLWYGWLRERTDSVVIPTVYHALSNVLLKTILVSLS